VELVASQFVEVRSTPPELHPVIKEVGNFRQTMLPAPIFFSAEGHDIRSFEAILPDFHDKILFLERRGINTALVPMIPPHPLPVLFQYP
jgi:hypothetical protein